MSVAVDTLRYRLLYDQLFGGAIAITKKQFLMVGGFANRFFGWGAEDDDMYKRVLKAKLKILRWPHQYCRYKMMPHKKASPNPHRFDLLSVPTENRDSLMGTFYQLDNVISEPLYTKFTVKL